MLADDTADAEESAPVVGGTAADTTFTACVHRTQRDPEFIPTVADMAENTDHGTCMLCFQPDFHPGPDFSDRTMIVCDSCEREYHVGCLRECGYSALEELPAGEWFCSQTCFHILKEVRGALLARCAVSNACVAIEPTHGAAREPSFLCRLCPVYGLRHCPHRQYKLFDAFITQCSKVDCCCGCI